MLLTNFQAEYGRNYGGSITTVTKAGTKAFHGGGYYFKRNEALNANDFFRNRDLAPPKDGKAPRSFYRYDYPGYYIGGPVLIPGLIEISRKAVLLLVAGVSATNGADPARAAYVPDRARAPRQLFANFRCCGAVIPDDSIIKDPTTGAPVPRKYRPGRTGSTKLVRGC